jgi:hypothetical protein
MRQYAKSGNGKGLEFFQRNVQCRRAVVAGDRSVTALAGSRRDVQVETIWPSTAVRWRFPLVDSYFMCRAGGCHWQIVWDSWLEHGSCMARCLCCLSVIEDA